MQFHAQARGVHDFADDRKQGRRRGRASAGSDRLAYMGLGVPHAPLARRNQLCDAHPLRVVRKTEQGTRVSHADRPRLYHRGDLGGQVEEPQQVADCRT